jgi:hypothetical protein
MTRYHLRQRESGWRHQRGITLAAAVLSTIVVAVFAVAKFTEGAWLIVVVFPVLVWVLIRLNREYRAEAAVLERVTTAESHPVNLARHHVFVLVDAVDLAVIEALRYGRSLRPDSMTAVHFMIDSVVADRLRGRWQDLGIDTPLRLVDVPDRRIGRAVRAFVTEELADDPAGGLTVLLPRRSYTPFLGRLLHDRSADHIARVISRIPRAAATIVPYDVRGHLRAATGQVRPRPLATAWRQLLGRLSREPESLEAHEHPTSEPDATPIGRLSPGRFTVIDGRLHELTVTEHADGAVTGLLTDHSGSVALRFDRPHPDLKAGLLLRLSGVARPYGAGYGLLIVNPSYRVLDDPDAADQPGDPGRA